MLLMRKRRQRAVELSDRDHKSREHLPLHTHTQLYKTQTTNGMLHTVLVSSVLEGAEGAEGSLQRAGVSAAPSSL